MTETTVLDRSRPSSAIVSPCWSCAGPVDAGALFCATCRAVQPPAAVDHFARLGLPAGFAIDIAELDRRYFAAQRMLHPDRFATKSARERAISQSQAVELNASYETLRAPLARACYLLRLKGMTQTPDREHTIDDPELLMEQMERREALAAADTPEAAARVADAAAAETEATIDAIAGAFARDDLSLAACETLRLRYLVKLADEARAARMRLAQRKGG
jgi:molecular chaperone HscB